MDKMNLLSEDNLPLKDDVDANEETLSEGMDKISDQIDEFSRSSFFTKKMIAIMFLSFIVPALIWGLIYANHGIVYNGKTTILTFDLLSQYAPFIYSIRYILSNPGQLFFNWNYCYGGNFLGVVTYYMMSPLNLITLLWKLDDFYNAIYVLMLLKTALCGLTFSILLKFKFKQDSWAMIIFSTCYALMSYNIAYGMCIMWMDAILLLPIVIIGVDLISEGKRGLVFFTSMGLVFFTNFYMSFFVGIFAALYFVLKIFVDYKKEELKKYFRACVLFGMNTIFALGISMPFILSTLMNMRGRTDAWISDEMASIYYQHTVVSILKSFLSSNYKTLYSGGLPFVFAGTFIYIIAIVFFIQKRKVREKIAAIVLVLCVTAGFFAQKIDWIWHGLKYPTGFSYRYSFLFSFLVILLAYDAFRFFDISKFIYRFIAIALCVFTLAELYMNGSVIIGSINKEIPYSTVAEFENYTQTYRAIAESIKNDADFFRVSSVSEIYTVNNSVMYNVNGAEFFSSTNNSSLSNFLEKIGNNRYKINLVSSSYAMTPIMDDIFDIKYRVSPGLVFLPESYKNVSHEISDNFFSMYLYKNEDAISLGYLKENEISSCEFGDNVFDNQVELLKYLGVEDIDLYHEMSYYYDIDPSDDGTTFKYTFKTNTKTPIYFYLDAIGDENDLVNISYDGESRYDTNAGLMRRVFYVGTFEPGEEHEIVIKGKLVNYQHFYLYEYDTAEAEKALNQLKKKQMTNIISNGNRIFGTVEADKECTLFTSIPYDKGYKVYIDGKQTEYNQALDAFIGVQIPEGHHEIEFVFVPEGFLIGCLISMISLIGVLMLYLCKSFFEKSCADNRL